MGAGVGCDGGTARSEVPRDGAWRRPRIARGLDRAAGLSESGSESESELESDIVRTGDKGEMGSESQSELESK